MKAWNLRRKTATLWCASLLLGLVFTGCSAEFNDQKCETEQDCFPGEICSTDGLCVPGNGEADAGIDATTEDAIDDVIEDVIEDVEGDTDDSDTVAPQQIFSVTLSPSAADVAPGRTVTLTATALDRDGDTIEGEGFSWTSSDPSVATVADGVVTGVALGEAIITVTSTFNPNISATSTVTVVTPSVERVEIDPTAADLLEGGTLQFSATAFDVDDAELPDATFTWSVEPASAATIDENGLLTALAYDAENDTVTVTVNAEGAEASATVTILLTPVDSITITDAEGGTDFSVEEDATLELSAAAFDADGNELTERDAIWSSDDETVATVDENGVVTGVSAGNANISVTIDGVTESVEVTVTEADVVLAPVADAGGDRTVEVNELVTLDASASTDPGGLALTFEWNLTVPTGSGTLISNSTGAQVTFIPDTAGDYIVELIVENSGGQTDTVTVTITAEAANTAPTAVIAGANPRNGQAGVVENLDATGSTDAEDDATALTYAWTFTQNPNGDTLVGADTATASYTPSDSGQYIVELTVTDSDGLSDTASVTIDTAPAATDNNPVVDAGSDVTISEGGSTTLAATATDVEDDAGDLIIGWTIAGPDTDLSQLSEATSLTAEFTPSAIGIYTLTLSVEDTHGNIVTDEVVITVETVVDVNTPPTVNAGSDVIIIEGASTTLAGTATDVEDDLNGTALTIAWTIEASSPDTDAAQLDDATSLSAVFSPTSIGEYTLTLTVTDSGPLSSSASITVTVNAATPTNTAPTANAGADATTTVGGSVTLAGTATDPDQDDSTLLAEWSIEASSPDTNLTQFDNHESLAAVFTPTSEGEYTLTLTVMDDETAISTDSVVITVNAVVVAGDCLIISEYVEGSSSNKALELYNCGSGSLDLTDYHYCLEVNDGSIASGCSQKYDLTNRSPDPSVTQLAANETLVLCNNMSDTGIKDKCDIETGTMAFNGDDRIIIFKDGGTPDGNYQAATDTIIDVFGELGNRNNAYAGKTFDRCDFTPWLGVGTFDVSAYYTEFAEDQFSGLGVAPTAGCTP